MKKEILDTPFRDSFSDFLEKGETILWQGKPNTNTLTTSFSFYIFFIILISIILFSIAIYHFQYIKFLLIGYSLFFIGVALFFFLRFRERNATKYFITTYQIIFQIKNQGKFELHSIAFHQIKDINVVTYEYPQVDGTIYFILKNPNSVQFQTFDFTNRNFRHQPTFEKLNDVETVVKLIRLGIQNANTLL